MATEVKGWPDWESWRMFMANQLKLPGRTWKFFSFDDPMAEIPAILVGPFSGWQARLPAPNVHTFADLIHIPEQYEFYRPNEGLATLQSSWPHQTCFTGLRRPDGRIICIEGHHRATAVALAAHDHRIIQFGEVRIALADMDQSEGSLLDEVLARGSTKVPPDSNQAKK